MAATGLGLTAVAFLAAPAASSGAQVPRYGGASAASVPAPAFTKTETIERNHLIDGADNVVDKRTVSFAVDQTSGLRERQEIQISWTGAHPTGGTVRDPNSTLGASQEYPVVIMECRGVDSAGAPASQQLSPSTCWTHTPEERYQSDFTNAFPAWRLDRYASVTDRGAAEGVPNPLPLACGSATAGIQHWVPFVAVDGTVYPGGLQGCAGIPPESVEVEQSLQPDNTTFAVTQPDGVGTVDFAVSTSNTNTSLGCSDKVKCSLVIIPIMGTSCDPAATSMPPEDRAPAGFLAAKALALCSATGKYLPGQPTFGVNQGDLAVSGYLWWSASNWRNRITVPLAFAPDPNACDLANPSTPTLVYGSELMAQATEQWLPAFCTDPKLFKLHHVLTGEPEAKNLLNSGSVQAAFQAGPPQVPFTRPTVQGPVALSAYTIVYAIDGKDQQLYPNLKLTPRLLAKLLTESYSVEPVVRDYYPALSKNPLNIAADPEFQALNPGLPVYLVNDIPAAALYTISSNSDAVWSLTSYINADPEARAWLNGTPDPWGMVVNPNYKKIQLPLTNWPLLDSFASGPAYGSDSPCLNANPIPYLQLVASPVSTMATVTFNMQFGLVPSQLDCFDPGAKDQKLTALGREAVGDRFLIAMVPLADAQRYKLHSALLETHVAPSAPAKFTDSTGRTFTGPNDASLAAAARLMQADTKAGTWVLPYAQFRTNPAAAGAYPGTMLMSLDVPLEGLSPTLAEHYSQLLQYAVGPGQVPGPGVGQLPPGYVPMTAANGLGFLTSYTQRAASAVSQQTGQVPPLNPPPSSPSTTVASPSSGQTSASSSSGTSSSGSGSGGSSGQAAGSGAASGAGTSPAGAHPAPALVQPARAVGTTAALGAGATVLVIPFALGVAILAGIPAGYALRPRRGRGQP